MHRFNGPGRARCLLGSLLLLSIGAHAQSYADQEASSYTTEYQKRLKSYQTVQPYGDTPFGESIDLATGQVTFTQTDIVLEGTGPTIRVSRSRSATGFDVASLDPPPAQVLGDWTLNLPRISTLVQRPRGVESGGNPHDNWRMSKVISESSRARCTNFGWVWVGQSGIPLEDWWHGYELVMDDGATQPLLLRDSAYTAKPSTGASYPIVTLSDIQVSCLPTTKNGTPGATGEGFLAIAPDGTKYWFDWLVGTKGGPVTKNSAVGFSAGEPETPDTDAPDSEAPPPDAGTMGVPVGTLQIQERMQAAMFVTRVEDRFGNFVTYTYDVDNPLRLTSIVASDGRKVSFAWNGNLLASATAQPDTPANARTWRYEYAYDGKLLRVVLPDDSRWSFDLKRTGEGALADMFATSCLKRYNANAPASDEDVSTITAPSGLVGTFVMRHRWHARSYANSACMQPIGGEDYETNPPLFENLSLVQRTWSGPGLANLSWIYAYSPAQASAMHDACVATASCPDTSWVDVTEPDGARTRYTHSTRDGVLEGKLLKTETFEAGGALLRTEILQYPVLASLPFQAHLGLAPGSERSNTAKKETRYPAVGRTIIQQGRKFLWAVPADCGPSSNQWCLDAFGRATKTVKSSEETP